MKHRAIILFPIFLLLATILYSLYLMAPLYLNTFMPVVQELLKNSPLASQLTQKVKPYIPQTSPEELILKVNQYRVAQALSSLEQDPSICQATPSLPSQASDEEVFGVCRNCTHATVISISKFAQPNLLLARLLEESSTSSTIIDPDFTHLCINEKGDNLTLLFAREKSAAPPVPQAATIVRRQISPAPSASPTSFTEDQLWQALVDYRHAHQKPDLQRDEHVCTYARKRVQDHISLINSKKPEAYPNPDKYPLDAHQGFAADADSGYAFDVTGVNHLAENLAYYPGAESASHIIEWGWDTSTEGHREAQLSTEFSKACISGGDGFYVAIFGG